MSKGQRLLVLLVFIGLTIGYFWGNQVTPGDVVAMIPFIELAVSLFLALCSIFIHVLLHEAGHLLFGKLTGYRLIYFQTPLFRYEGKSRSFTKPKPLGGALGQCLMSPPEAGSYEEKPYQLYMAGGLLVNLLIGVGLYIGAFLLPGRWGFHSLIFSLTPIWMFLTNGLPHNYTDGRVLKELRKSSISKRLFFKQLEAAKWAEEGLSLLEYPENHFEEATNGEAQRSFLGEYPMMMEYQRQLLAYNFSAADELLQTYLSHWDYMKSVYARQVSCELLFCHAIFGRKEKAQEMLAHIEKYNGLKGQYDHNFRVQAAYAFFVEVDVEKTRKILAEEQEKEGLILNEGEQELENQLKGWLNNYLVYLS